MQDPASELAQEWLVRAEHDLRVARYLLTMPDPPPEIVGFHAQQCVEDTAGHIYAFVADRLP